MLKKVLKLYTTAMTCKVYSPVPHLFGPPGSGKSSVVQQAADLLGVKLHTINVSRISPLELEGVQMPSTDHKELHLLTATYWKQLKEGDIILWDELLRGFPEVYNGILDVMTAREIGGFKLPNVFMIGASNSTVAYDKALEDRLLHIPVADPRKNKAEYKRLSKLLVEETGLMPIMADSYEMQALMDSEVLPTFEILDQIDKRAGIATANTIKGSSLRKLIGQVQLRELQSHYLQELVKVNNARAADAAKPQYIVLCDEHSARNYKERIGRLEAVSHKLSATQRTNYLLNQQFIELAEIQDEERRAHEEKETQENEAEFFA